MFAFGDQSNLIDKARRVAAKGDSLKAIKILKNALRNEESDLPLILEIMHTYHAIDKLNEVIIWAEKGSSVSPEAKKKIEGEVEDLFYGRGKPDRLAEYLMEKWTERRDFEGVSDLLRDMSEESKETFLQREKQIVDNILDNKKKFSPRDLTHLYLFGIMSEGRNSKGTLRVFREIAEKEPQEMERIIMELRRAERDNYGDEYLKFGLGEFLLKDKHYVEGVSKLKESVNKNPELREKALSILTPYDKDSKEVLDYLSELLIESGKEEKALSLIDEFEVEDAIKKYQRMVKKDKDNPVIHKQLAEAYFKKERYSEGLEEFLSAVSISADEGVGARIKEFEDVLPEDIDNYLNLANIYNELGWEEEVVRILGKAFEISPSGSGAILESLNQIFKDSEFPSSALLLKARLLSRKGEAEAALEIYKEMSLDPAKTKLVEEELKKFRQENPVSTEGEIISLMLQIPENPQEIAQKVNLIISEEPDSIPVILTEFDKRVKAKPEFTEQFLKFYKNLDREKFPPFTYPFALAELYRGLENFDKARQFYKEAVKEQPERFKFVLNYLQGYREEPVIRKIIASLYFDKGEYEKGCLEIENTAKEYPEYVGDITTFLISEAKKRKDNKIISQVLTKILIRNNYYEEAIKWGKRALESLELEEQPDLMIALAKANSKTSNLSETASLIRKAIGLDGSLSEEAIEILEDVREGNVAEQETLMTLYKLYREKGNVDGAVSCLEEVLTLNPSMLDVMLEECKKLVDIAPIHSRLRIFYGKVKLSTGDLSGIEELEKGIRFDPTMKNEVSQVLESIDDPRVEKEALILKATIEKGLGHSSKALKDFIEAYWKSEEKRDKIIENIGGLLPEVELSTELVGKLLKVYANENRNVKLVNIIDKFFDGSTERGKYLLKEIESLFEGTPPLPLRIMLAKIYYRVGDKEKSKTLMDELLLEIPDVAEKLKEIIKPDDPQMYPLLVKINLELSDWGAAVNYIQKLELKDQLSFYEELLDKKPNMEEALKEAAYLYFVAGNPERAEKCLKKLKKPGDRGKVLLWFLGKNVEASIKKIKEERERILRDRIRVTESPEKRAYLHMKLNAFDEAVEVAKELEEEKRELILSVIQEKLGDYWGAYQRLSRLSSKNDFRERRALLAFNSGQPELALGLLSKTEMNPVRKKQLLSLILRETMEDYSRIKPLIRR